jgi:DNA-binding NarL/FixJ family response regulator
MNNGKGASESSAEAGGAPQANSAPPEAAPAPAPGRRRAGYHRTRPTKSGARARGTVRREVDLSRLVAVVSALPIDGEDASHRRRRLLAEMCKVVGAHLSGATGVAEEHRLPPRLRQTLQGLIRGDSEKQIAGRLNLSPHTVHVYVKQLYKRFNASSRGELLARFIRGGN